MVPDEQLRWAKACGLAGGALLLANAVFSLLVLAFVGTLATYAMGISGAAELPARLAVVALALVAVGVVLGAALGALALVAAVRLDGPSGRAWALALLVSGLVSLPFLGGWVVGGLLAAVGGGLAMAAHGREGWPASALR